MLSDEDFWDVVRLCDADNDSYSGIQNSAMALKSRDESDIYEFEDKLSMSLFLLDRKEIALSKYGNMENFSGDEFLYIRCGIVVKGFDFFQQALGIQAQSVLIEKVEAFEALLYVASTAFRLRTGRYFEYSSKINYETCANEEGWGI